MPISMYNGRHTRDNNTKVNIMRVIPHPTQNGYWTIAVDGSIYGCYDRRELAIAVLLTM